MTTSRRSLCVLAAFAPLLALSLTATAQDLTVDVPAPDGTSLATDVYLPIGSGSWPVVLIRTPYGRSGEGSLCRTLTFLGKACVAQDTRGRFGSGGQDTVFRDDGPDGRATLEWLAEQRWCNGRVATFGGSALGITQYLAAPRAPSLLRCQQPVVATTDLYHHGFYQGGALREALIVNWLEGQGSADSLGEALSHRLLSEWWRPVRVIEDAPMVQAPGLHVGGWYDIFSQGTLSAFRSIQKEGGEGALGRQYLMMGPWTHGGIGSAQAGELRYPDGAVLQLAVTSLAWLDAWLGEPGEGPVDWPAVSVYLMGAVDEPGAPGNRWVAFDSWPPIHSVHPLYLTSDGRLTHSINSPGTVQLTIDPGDPVPTLGGANLFPDLTVGDRPMGDGPHDQRPIEGRSDVLTFTTAPLTRPLTVTGRVRCRLWVRSDTPDLDLAVRLTDVYPDGRSMLVIDGIQRARARCGSDRECLLEPGVPAEIEVDLWSTALVFNTGHRLRISISGSNWPRFEVNPNHGQDLDGPAAPIPANPLILTGDGTPSHLALPVARVVRRPAGRPRLAGEVEGVFESLARDLDRARKTLEAAGHPPTHHRPAELR